MMKKVLKWLLIAMLVLAVVGFMMGEGEEAVETEDATEQVAQEETATEPVEEEVIEEEEPSEPDMTLAQENAIGAAENYLNVMAFSKSGLIEQLSFDGFEQADAEFAVENIEVDWNEQAVKSGENYLDTMSFSKAGLIEQLKFDGFTDEQAAHAVETIGL